MLHCPYETKRDTDTTDQGGWTGGGAILGESGEEGTRGVLAMDGEYDSSKGVPVRGMEFLGYRVQGASGGV